MLPLDIVDPARPSELAYPSQLQNWLGRLKEGGVEGIMADFWWGIVEREGPKRYNWDAYLQLVEMCASLGLKVCVVASFHRCGGNVGDSCDIR